MVKERMTEMREIKASEVKERLEAGETLNLIDVRQPEEVAEGHIKGITHIPLGELPGRIGELDHSKEYIMVCRSSARSGQATEYLTANGFNAVNMAGGMLAWPGETVKNFSN